MKAPKTSEFPISILVVGGALTLGWAQDVRDGGSNLRLVGGSSLHQLMSTFQHLQKSCIILCP